MSRLIVAVELAAIGLAFGFTYAVIFHPEAVGIVPAKIIVGFQRAYESGKK